MVSELLQPPCDVGVCLMFRDVIDEECSDRSAIVCRGNGAITFLTGWRAGDPLDGSSKGVTEDSNAPVSQICALTVLPSMANERVANSTPIVDFDSRLNSLRVNRESTVIQANAMHDGVVNTSTTKYAGCSGEQHGLGIVRRDDEHTVTNVHVWSVCGKYGYADMTTYDLPTPESPISTTCRDRT